MANQLAGDGSKVEKLAHNAFTLGLTSPLCGITALPSIIYAVRALIALRRYGGSRVAPYKAVFGLLFSSAMLALMVFLIEQPLSAAKMMAEEIQCRNQVKEMSLEIQVYEGNNSDELPPLRHWCDAIAGTNLPAAKFHCPAAPQQQACGFAMNINLKDVKNTYTIPNDTVMIFESDAGWNAVGGPEIAVARHYSYLHVGYVDGSVDLVKGDDIRKLRWVPVTNSPAR